MNKTIDFGKVRHALASVLGAVMCAALCICANTNSSVLIYQPKMPKGMERFRKVK